MVAIHSLAVVTFRLERGLILPFAAVNIIDVFQVVALPTTEDPYRPLLLLYRPSRRVRIMETTHLVEILSLQTLSGHYLMATVGMPYIGAKFAMVRVSVAARLHCLRYQHQLEHLVGVLLQLMPTIRRPIW
jgi:hypothetical protein